MTLIAITTESSIPKQSGTCRCCSTDRCLAIKRLYARHSMDTPHSTTPKLAIRVQPEAVLRTGLALHSSDLPAPLFIRSGSAFEEAPDAIVIDSARQRIRTRFTTH